MLEIVVKKSDQPMRDALRILFKNYYVVGNSPGVMLVWLEPPKPPRAVTTQNFYISISGTAIALRNCPKIVFSLHTMRLEM